MFAIKAQPRSKLLAVMKNDDQLMCSTLIVDEGEGAVEKLRSTTGWSEWQEMEEGLRARWRLVVKDQPSR